MLKIGKPNDVKFKVEVNGTQAAPKVRLVLELPNAELSFPAEPLLGEQGAWFSEVKIPEGTEPGNYQMRVEVIVNDRIFTPVKKSVEVGNEPVVYAAEGQPASPPTPTQTPDQTRTWEEEGGKPAEVPEKPKPLPAEPVKEAYSLLKRMADTKPPVKKTFTVKTPLPRPSMNRKEPIRIKMAEVAAESEKLFADIWESETYHKPGKAVKPIDINPRTPVTLKKGEVVYE